MQKNATPCSWVAAYWRKPPIRLPRCFSPVGWMPEKMRIGVLSLTFVGREARDPGHGNWPGVVRSNAPEQGEEVERGHRPPFLAVSRRSVKTCATTLRAMAV